MTSVILYSNKKDYIVDDLSSVNNDYNLNIRSNSGFSESLKISLDII